MSFRGYWPPLTIVCRKCSKPFESEWKQRRHCDDCKAANDKHLYERRLRHPISDSVRWAVFERDGGRCQICGVKLHPKIEWDTRYEQRIRAFQVDHKVPLSKGGTSHIDNLQAVCGPCNRSKGIK